MHLLVYGWESPAVSWILTPLSFPRQMRFKETTRSRIKGVFAAMAHSNLLRRPWSADDRLDYMGLVGTTFVVDIQTAAALNPDTL